MRLIDALEIVHSLADQGRLDDPDPGMTDQVRVQREAVFTLEDLIVNHGETLDEMNVGIAVSELDLEAFRQISDGPLTSALAVSLELAAQNLPDDPDLLEEADRLSWAIDIVSSFWREKGSEIEGKISQFSVFEDLENDPSEP